MDFREEFNRIWNKIEKGEHFALARYGDGEHMLIEGEEVGKGTQACVQDKRMAKEGISLLGKDLKDTLDMVDDNYIYAIPCRCCNDRGKQRYLANLKTKNVTYANIFINANYQEFKSRLKTLKKKINVIGNIEGVENLKKNGFPFQLDSYYPVGNDCVNFYEQNKMEFIMQAVEVAKNHNNQIFFISAGPLANILVYTMWTANPNNTYIDTGSALDEWIKGRITRGFQRPEDYYAKKYCVF